MSIDTIALSKSNITVKQNNKLEIVSSKDCKGQHTEGNRVLFNGIIGTKAYYNDELINITVKPLKNRSYYNYLHIKCSIPKVLSNGKNNIDDKGTEGNKQFIEWLYDKVNDIGIELNKNELEISRIDQYKNIELKLPCIQYASVYSVLNAVHRQNSNMQITSSHRQGNKSFQVNFYDKIQECKDTGKVIPDEYYNKNLLRAEARHLKKSKVNYDLRTKLYGIENKLEIITDDKVYRELMNLYDSYMTMIFDVELDDLNMDTMGKLAIAEYCKAKGMKITEAMKLGYLTELMNSDLLEEYINIFYGKSKSDRSAKSRFLRKTKNIDMPVPVELAMKFDELKSKVLSNV